jgi:uncharacterized membrane protein
MRIKLPLIFSSLLIVSACSSDSENEVAPDAQVASADAAAADTWESFALGFVTTYCHECHGPGDSLRDYSLLETVRGEEDKIRCGVSTVSLQNCTISPRQFPIGNGAMPTDAERLRLVQWIEAGADRP